MCEIDIQDMLNKFIKKEKEKNENFSERNLEYQYTDGNGKQWGGDEVDKEFTNYKKKLDKELNNGTQNNLKDIIQEIFDWGGVGSEDLNELYTTRLLNGTKRLLDNDFAIYSVDGTTNWENVCRSSEITIKGKEKTKSPELSSWSKVLAAYTFGDETANNEKFFIYDSRVAIALNIIDKDHKWFLPSEYGHSVVFALIKQSRKKSESRQTSYQRYCESLRRKGGVTLERQLFMLGGYLDYNAPEDWREHICVKIPAEKKKQ